MSDTEYMSETDWNNELLQESYQGETKSHQDDRGNPSQVVENTIQDFLTNAAAYRYQGFIKFCQDNRNFTNDTVRYFAFNTQNQNLFVEVSVDNLENRNCQFADIDMFHDFGKTGVSGIVDWVTNNTSLDRNSNGFADDVRNALNILRRRRENLTDNVRTGHWESIHDPDYDYGETKPEAT